MLADAKHEKGENPNQDRHDARGSYHKVIGRVNRETYQGCFNGDQRDKDDRVFSMNAHRILVKLEHRHQRGDP